MTDQNTQDIKKLLEDVGYIRGQMNTVVSAHEPRISRLESMSRNQNILGVLATAVLGYIAAIKSNGG